MKRAVPGCGEVDTAVEHVGAVREERTAHARRRLFGRVEVGIPVGHDERNSRGPTARI